MEFHELEQGLKAIASSGHVLNVQELTSLQAGLIELQTQVKSRAVYFWGKMFGCTSDYYIAYEVGEADFEFPSKTFYCAGEDFKFVQLERLTEEIADRVIDLGLDSPFTGNLSAPVENGAGGGTAAEPGQKLVESHRLAQVVQEIDFDTATVPKGAYALNEAHVTVDNSDFRGLSLSEAKDLKNYVHFRPPTSVAALRAFAQSDAEFFKNFLDPLESDLPKGCWAVRQDLSVSLVTLRSLNWPGYSAYHIPGTKKFGGAYFGYGMKNNDLPFIL
eukprot:TRINITY_DN68684_c0_g1_i1.p1 TRINITY_DN68684_c0_g1~~TRINITY_DN68684_c0_g1_i1.p1  ORF type:complete len:274 (+),score=58.79 TRINITY_DN68684_c0_g1_i1:62-883(+)